MKEAFSVISVVVASIIWYISKILLCPLSKSRYIRKEQVMIRKLYLILSLISYFCSSQNFHYLHKEAGLGPPGSDTGHFSS